MDENVRNSCISREIPCSVIGNFQIGKIYAEAKIHHKGICTSGNKPAIRYAYNNYTLIMQDVMCVA